MNEWFSVMCGLSRVSVLFLYIFILYLYTLSVCIRILMCLGCGMVMLGVICTMYSVTESIIGNAMFVATVGFRQGSPTSCLLFIIYVNDLIKLIKDNCNDGFLKWLRVLILMDDTVLLSISREKLINKLSLMKKFCCDYGMKVNESKTKFFVINGTIEDKEVVRIEGLMVESCTQYMYLGSPFTADGSVSSSVKAQATAKMAHVTKFISKLHFYIDVDFFFSCSLIFIVYALFCALMHV